MVASNFACPVGQSMQCDVQATDCYGYTQYLNATWSSSDAAIMTVNSSTGLVTGVAPGGITLTAQLMPVQVDTGQVCTGEGGEPVCPTGAPPESTSAAVIPTISGPSVVWWFNGYTPSGYAVTITLAANAPGATSYTWSVVKGPITISNGTTETTNVQGTTWSATAGDASVTVAVNGQTSSPFAITVRGPKSLAAGQVVDTSDPTYGYLSKLNYTILDNLGAQMPSAVPLNEFFTTGIANDYPNTNWVRGPATGYTSSGSTFADNIDGQTTNYFPSALSPQSPLSSTKVDHWAQEWRVGSTTPGSGLRVQADTLQKYLDHARHLSIVTPDP